MTNKTLQIFEVLDLNGFIFEYHNQNGVDIDYVNNLFYLDDEEEIDLSFEEVEQYVHKAGFPGLVEGEDYPSKGSERDGYHLIKTDSNYHLSYWERGTSEFIKKFPLDQYDLARRELLRLILEQYEIMPK